MSMSPASPSASNLGHAVHGLRVEHTSANHAHRSGTLGDEDRVVRDEREAPRTREPASDDGDLDVLTFGCLVAHGLRGQRALADALRRHGNVVAKRNLLLRGRRCSGGERQRGRDDYA